MKLTTKQGSPTAAVKKIADEITDADLTDALSKVATELADNHPPQFRPTAEFWARKSIVAMGLPPNLINSDWLVEQIAARAPVSRRLARVEASPDPSPHDRPPNAHTGYFNASLDPRGTISITSSGDRQPSPFHEPPKRRSLDTASRPPTLAPHHAQHLHDLVGQRLSSTSMRWCCKTRRLEIRDEGSRGCKFAVGGGCTEETDHISKQDPPTPVLGNRLSSGVQSPQ